MFIYIHNNEINFKNKNKIEHNLLILYPNKACLELTLYLADCEKSLIHNFSAYSQKVCSLLQFIL